MSLSALSGLSGLSSLVRAGAFSPLNLSPLLWLDASAISSKSDGDTITSWSDLSGNAKHATEATNPPTYKTNIINSLPVVRFDGSNDKLTTGVTESLTNFTMFAVAKLADTQQSYERLFDKWYVQGFFLSRDSTTPDVVGSFVYGGPTFSTRSATDDAFHVFVVARNSTTQYLRVDGSQTTATCPSTALSSHALLLGTGWNDPGSGYLNFCDCDIAEVVLLNTFNISSDLENYFKSKYGLSF